MNKTEKPTKRSLWNSTKRTVSNSVACLEGGLDAGFGWANRFAIEVWRHPTTVDFRHQLKLTLARIGDEILTNIVEGTHQAFGQKCDGEVFLFRSKPARQPEHRHPEIDFLPSEKAKRSPLPANEIDLFPLEPKLDRVMKQSGQKAATEPAKAATRAASL